MARLIALGTATVAAVVVAAGVAACGSSRDSSFDDGSGADAGGNSSGFLPTGDGASPPAGCTGIACNVVACSGGGHTTLSGTAFAPNGTDPLYNVILYVPNADLQPFAAGVTCDKCGAVTSGEPIATALSDAAGKFTLVDVPAGDDVPLVLQVGRWRRKVIVPHIEACKDTPLDADLTRLPKNKAEGDIPLMALATSPYDPEECILRKIGIDDAEFTIPTEAGRVHIYKGAGATLAGATPPAASTMWATAQNLERYDIVMLPCQTSGKPDAAGNGRIKEYADNGGRVFITDLSEDTIKSGPAPWPTTATWSASGSFTNPGLVDTTFPKGQALADWLDATGATTTKGQLTLNNTFHRFGAAAAGAQRWIYSSTDTQTYSFNTPFEAAKPEDQCGRVVYSSFHVATGAGASFPSECNTTPLTAQEKALEFLLFDLAACIQKDDVPPAPPPVK